MICASIKNKTLAQIEAVLEKVEMAEIRLDLCELDDEQIQQLFCSDTPLIATCRAVDGNFRETERKLGLAIEAGAHYVDLEIEAPKSVSKRLADACAQWGTVMIRSYHNFECTPSLDDLREIADRCRHHDGQVVKIVTTATSEEDAKRVGELYKYYTAESLVAFAMGEKGAQSRLDCLSNGAPFSYAALDKDECTAPGQYDYDSMYSMVYGDRKSLDIPLVHVPASKSYAQRAIIAAALADGKSELGNFSTCRDTDAAISVAESLGAKISFNDAPDDTRIIAIEGIGARQSSCDIERINVSESGLLTRIMIPLAANISSKKVTIEGEGTLLSRPLAGAAAAVRAMGAKAAPVATISEAAPSATSENLPEDDLIVPLSVQGPLKGGRIVVDGSKSSQIVSGALMALPLCPRNSSLSVMNPTSIPYIYMTMDILRKFGVKTRSEMYGGRQLLDNDWDKCTEILLKIKENQAYKAASFNIEGDWSAATVFLAAGAIFGSVSVAGLDTSSIQSDLCMLDLLMEAGASISQLDEPTGVISVRKAPLQAFDADLSNSPDLFPVVAVLCAFCQGKNRLRGVHRLLHKESNRADGILNMLKALGVDASIKGDDLIIAGESLDSRIMNKRLLKGGAYTSNHDHRMVMALRLAELGADNRIEIDDVECASKSFPEFNRIWNEYIWKEL